MQMKFNFNIFSILWCVSAAAWQRVSGIRQRHWRL